MEPDPASIASWLDEGTSDPQAVAARYDEWARTYDGDLADWSYQGPAVVADIVAARRPDADPVLDVGCGTGLVGRALRSRGLAGRILGLDISAASLQVAEQTGVYSSLEVADLQQRLPLDDDSVGAVVCVGVMTYLPEVEQVWRELARVTQPQGIVVVTQREDIWHDRGCQAVADRLVRDGTWSAVDVSGPAPYLPDGYGGTPAVPCYYLTAQVG